MLTQEQILQFLNEHKSFFSKEFHVSKIGIFGSFARNEQRPDSDIDVLIELDGQATNIYDLKWALREFLKQKFNREVDVCNSKHIKPSAKAYILKDAIYA
jgi:predicted nucleotidyltransferase